MVVGLAGALVAILGGLATDGAGVERETVAVAVEHAERADEHDLVLDGSVDGVAAGRHQRLARRRGPLEVHHDRRGRVDDHRDLDRVGGEVRRAAGHIERQCLGVARQGRHAQRDHAHPDVRDVPLGLNVEQHPVLRRLACARAEREADEAPEPNAAEQNHARSVYHHASSAQACDSLGVTGTWVGYVCAIVGCGGMVAIVGFSTAVLYRLHAARERRGGGARVSVRSLSASSEPDADEAA